MSADLHHRHFGELCEFLANDVNRLKALDCVAKLLLPHCYVAAGFVRNMVWDRLHHHRVATELNDVDVIYFDSAERDVNAYLRYETQLRTQMPQVNWQVRNQAVMHKRNGDPAYQNLIDAMSYWPEKETAVAVRLVQGQLEAVSAFGFESLFRLEVTPNPKRDKAIFAERLHSKGWLTRWPQLTVME